jgi:lysophospholipase L1-like esterase
LFVAILLPISLPAALVLAEFMLRATDAGKLRNPALEPFAITLDGGIHRVSQIPNLYWELAPNQREKFQGVWVTTNSRGFRDRDYGPRSDATRIVVLGDSITFGAAVAQDEAYPKALERLLNRRGRAEVINCAVSGYNFIQYAVNYEHKARAYEPDLAIIEMFGDDMLPPYVPREKSAWLWLELHSRLYLTVKRYLESTNLRLSAAQEFQTREAMMAGMNRLIQFVGELRGEGRLMLFVLHPGLDDRERPEDNAVMNDVKHTLDLLHAPYIDLAPVYRAHGGSLARFSTNPLAANPHPNALGHEVIAEAIDAFLQKDASGNVGARGEIEFWE